MNLYVYEGPDQKKLLARFWEAASGFWKGTAAWRAWLLVVLLILLVIVQLLVQYLFNYWNRDFFNAIERKDTVAVWNEAKAFVPLFFASVALAAATIWGRMTLHRAWRQWLSKHLLEYWLENQRARRLKFTVGETQTPEYRIAEDARVSTEAPVDLVVGLLTSVLTAAVFLSVLWTIGDGLVVSAFHLTVVVPRYLVISVVVYSLVLIATTIHVGRRFTAVVEGKNRAEAEFRAIGSHIRETSEGTALPDGELPDYGELYPV